MPQNMNVDAFLDDLRRGKDYADQIAYVRTVEARAAVYARPARPLPPEIADMLKARGIEQLYSHQAAAIDKLAEGHNVVVVSATAGGKSLCYQLPLLQTLLADPQSTALLLFPTKALAQDQLRSLNAAMTGAGIGALAGVYDGDTPASLRRRLRDGASVILTNPDMLHAAIMPQHGRWQRFLANLRLVVLDELHVYTGLLGSNVANLMRRFHRVCGHYGSCPQMVACSATVANPLELAQRLTGRPFELVDNDGSPRGRRTYVFWNPPRLRDTPWRSRRSANVEAHSLMAELIRRGHGTITFSKAKMTAEMIHRYVCENLQASDPALVKKVTPYRGGYEPSQRREIEKRLFAGELLGVSATRALELGIDVGSLEAAIIVGYPGTRVSFFQQTGRAGRNGRDTLIILVGLDTSVNQYILGHPEYLFGRAVEEAVIDPDNPFIVTGHLRCATHELPLEDSQRFGPDADLALSVLAENGKVRRIDGQWYHAAGETPQHEISLRDCVDANVLIQDADTGAAMGEVNRFDAPPILHPGAIYMHLGQTYRVTDLDLDRNVATVKAVEVDYYTDPHGGTDVHHVDQPLREKPFGGGKAFWGEVTAYFNTYAYDKVHFYTLDAVSTHRLDLPTFTLETTALWLVPPEQLMADVLARGIDHSGLMGIGYATRMLLPLLVTCDTLDFSHSIGAVNAPWNSIFIYERYPRGLGFTQKAFERLGELMPAVLANIKACDCDDGCPCCVGKPLRQDATWYYDRHEAFIPSKRSAIAILEGTLAGGALNAPAVDELIESDEARRTRLERMLRRRLEQMRKPIMFHPIEPVIKTEIPAPTPSAKLKGADTAARRLHRKDLTRELRKRLANKIVTDQFDAMTAKVSPPQKVVKAHHPPAGYPGRPDVTAESADQILPAAAPAPPAPPKKPIILGNPLAAAARRKKHKG
ncbi:MAG: DEAD/DEAH box helicase [Planctomycetaceae bacterium]|nr:DEAD/DEAH box helicase [Planctomycetaceae bacterium]